MARRKAEPQQDTDLSTDLSILLNGTEGSIVSSTNMVHGRDYVPTPIPELNSMIGGGLPLSIMVEAFGDPASGKSSTMYETMGNFQRKFTDGIGIIVDSEASVDEQRMSYMGVDPTRVIRLSGSTIEKGFAELFKVLDNIKSNDSASSRPVMVIWDTISQGNTEAQFDEKNPDAGRMMAKPKILKTQLGNLMPYFESMNMLVILLNQVTTEMTRFGAKLNSSGGWGIKHAVHLRLQFSGGKTDYDGAWARYKHSTLNMRKSKISPLFENISITLDVGKAGVVDQSRTMLDYIANNNLPYLANKGGWWNCHYLAERYPEYIGKFDKFVQPDNQWRARDLTDYMEGVPSTDEAGNVIKGKWEIEPHPELLRLFQLALVDQIAQLYPYQGTVSEGYRADLISEINGLVGYDPEATADEDVSTDDNTSETTDSNSGSAESNDTDSGSNSTEVSSDSETDINEDKEDQPTE